MPIYAKADPTKPIINGLVTVGGGVAVPQTYDPAPTGAAASYAGESEHIASGEQLALYQSLEGRYLRDGWYEQSTVDAAASTDTVTAASGSNAAIYYQARDNRQHVLSGVAFAYETTPTSGELVIQSPSGTTVFSQLVTAAGAGYSDWPAGLRGPKGSDMLVLLRNGAARKTLSIKGHYAD